MTGSDTGQQYTLNVREQIHRLSTATLLTDEMSSCQDSFM